MLFRSGSKLPFQQVPTLLGQRRAAGLALAEVLRLGGLAIAPALLLLGGPAVQAGVRFENCQGGADGAITCDTVPTGNTLAEEETARYGLLQDASPGWNEFDPFAGDGVDFGGNQT